MNSFEIRDLPKKLTGQRVYLDDIEYYLKTQYSVDVDTTKNDENTYTYNFGNFNLIIQYSKYAKNVEDVNEEGVYIIDDAKVEFAFDIVENKEKDIIQSYLKEQYGI